MNPHRLRHFLIGIALGIIVPMAAFYAFFYTNYNYMPFVNYIKMLSLRSMLSKVMAIAAVPNLLIFYLCLWTNKDSMARGVLGGTVFTAVVVAVLYFVY